MGDSSYRSTNFKSKPQGPKGGIRANVVHSSPMGLKNYPHWTPRGGVLIEDHVAFHNTVGIMCKNGYSYTNDSPYFEDGKEGRTSQRYTVRNALLIGNIAAVHTINGPTKMHVGDISDEQRVAHGVSLRRTALLRGRQG